MPFLSAELHRTLLAGRDKANCSLSRNLGLTGKHTSCSFTGLPYMNCCGGKPLPVAIARHILSGYSFKDALELAEKELVERGARVRTRQPFNHLLPKPEGSPRQRSHTKGIRRLQRIQLTPSFEKRSASPF